MGKFKEFIDRQKLKIGDKVSVSGDTSYNGVITDIGLNYKYYTVKDKDDVEHEEQANLVHRIPINEENEENEENKEENKEEITYEDIKQEMIKFLDRKFGGGEDNKFDIEGAIYYFCKDYYTGQDSDGYKILSTSDFSPGPMKGEIRNWEKDSEIMVDMYDALSHSNFKNRIN
jgi:hypothetical protein